MERLLCMPIQDLLSWLDCEFYPHNFWFSDKKLVSIRVRLRVTIVDLINLPQALLPLLQMIVLLPQTVIRLGEMFNLLLQTLILLFRMKNPQFFIGFFTVLSSVWVMIIIGARIILVINLVDIAEPPLLQYILALIRTVGYLRAPVILSPVSPS